MDIIAVILAGFALLIFIMVFQKRNNKRVEKMMQQNRNVEPLFKQAAAKNKYQTLYDELKQQPAVRKQLTKLHKDFTNKKIGIDAYHDALNQLAEQYVKH